MFTIQSDVHIVTTHFLFFLFLDCYSLCLQCFALGDLRREKRFCFQIDILNQSLLTAVCKPLIFVSDCGIVSVHCGSVWILQRYLDEAMHLLTRLQSSLVSQGQLGFELYDWKQVARSLYPY